VSAPLALVLAAVWWFDHRDDPATHPGVDAAELRVINEGRTSAATHMPLRWTQLLADRDLICVTLSYFCLNYVFYLFFNWFYYYLTEIRQVPPTLGGYFVGAQWMVGTVTAVIGGVACDRLSARIGATRGCRIIAMSGLLISVPLLIVGTLSESALLCVSLLSLSFGCIQFVDASYWTATTRIAGHDAQAETGMMNTGGNVVGGIGAMLVPAIAGVFGWTVALASGALFTLVGAALWLGIRADETVHGRVVAATGLPLTPLPAG
jgi:MFS transporter, ACS family, glucarate transporter